MNNEVIAPRFYVAVVDSDHDSARRLSNALQLGLKDCMVVAYDSAEALLEAIQRRPFRIPIAVVADTAARTPSVEKGVFVLANNLIRRCRGIYYSTQPNEKDISRMVQLRVLRDWFVKSDPDSIDKLRESACGAFRDYTESVDSLIIETFANSIATTPHPEECAVEGVDDSLSPVSMLTEMLRGTDLGKEYLRNLLPLSMLNKQQPPMAAQE
jgi:hypothetical protein